MVDRSIINAVKNYLRVLGEHGIVSKKGVIFGSFATGSSHKWSDIDLLVISARYDKQYTHKEVVRLWQVAARTDSRIEPIPCGEKAWIDNDSSPIIEVARQEGFIVYLED